MTNETQQSSVNETKHTPFGERLRTARESMGLERKDVATQLRLSEKIIVMMEKDRYPVDLPITFIRGYIKSYGKLLQIPDYEIRKGIEPIKPPAEPVAAVPVAKATLPVTSGNYFMQFFTYLIVCTLIGLVATWWYTHQSVPSTLTETHTIPITAPEVNQPVSSESGSTSLPATLSAPALPDTAANHPPIAEDAAINHPPVAGTAIIDNQQNSTATTNSAGSPASMQPSIMQPPQSAESDNRSSPAEAERDQVEPNSEFAE